MDEVLTSAAENAEGAEAVAADAVSAEPATENAGGGEPAEAAEPKAADGTQSAPNSQAGPGEHRADRNFESEMSDLLREFPQATQNGPLPKEVIHAAVWQGKSVLEAYRDYALSLGPNGAEGRRGQAAQRQNDDNARRAPVRGVSGGFAVGNQAKDAFMSGFDED